MLRRNFAHLSLRIAGGGSLALAAALLLSGCRSVVPHSGTNLIVISIDTLRADHMSLHGYDRDTTPRLNAFADRAVTFEHARAPWTKTVPSMLSMFTGRPPHVTGVMFHSYDQYIRDDELLLAEIAKQHGLDTGAVVSNSVLGAATNFGQGFDDYIETYRRRASGGNRADGVTDAAVEWLDGQADDTPFFLWVHYVDPHARYEPPAKFAESFFNDALYDRTSVPLNDDNSNHGGIPRGYWRRTDGQQELGWYVANYDGEVVFTDAEIGRLLDVIEARGLLSNSVVIITADHGESLGEHDYFFEHGFYPYNASAWIPLVVYWPDVPEPGRRVTYPVSLVDLAPTIVDLMGWAVDQPHLLPARSLGPVLRGAKDRIDDYVVVEAGEDWLERDGFLRSLEDARWKLIQVPNPRYQELMQGVEFELYDVRADPMETTNVVAQHPELVAHMKKELARRLAAAGPVGEGSDQHPEYSDKELETLRTLGYIR